MEKPKTHLIDSIYNVLNNLSQLDNEITVKDVTHLRIMHQDGIIEREELSLMMYYFSQFLNMARPYLTTNK